VPTGSYFDEAGVVRWVRDVLLNGTFSGNCCVPFGVYLHNRYTGKLKMAAILQSPAAKNWREHYIAFADAAFNLRPDQPDVLEALQDFLLSATVTKPDQQNHRDRRYGLLETRTT